MDKDRKQDSADVELASLSALSRKELVDFWLETHGHPPPKGCKRGLLERDRAYRIQARHYGELNASTRKKLLAIARNAYATGRMPATEVKPGTRLVREWHGRTHHVEVTKRGCIWNGKTYQSLSAVARAITGARWSGPRFFGL